MIHTDYFLKLRARFADQGLASEEKLEFNDWHFDIMARHIRYDVMTVPVYLEEFFSDQRVRLTKPRGVRRVLCFTTTF